LTLIFLFHFLNARTWKGATNEFIIWVNSGHFNRGLRDVLLLEFPNEKIMWLWLIKFLGGFIPTGTKPFGEWIGKILWVCVWIAIGLTIYHKTFEAKNVTTIEKIETQVINQCQEKKDPFLGLNFNLWKLKLGLGI
jgi:hypothetical protein